MTRPSFKQISDTVWEISKKFKKGMRVPARVIASKKLLDQMEDGVFEQLTNVATLPGIQKYAIGLPDSHIGYGFNIGGVGAFDLDEGVISPGGIGFDINCLSGDTEILSELGFRKKIAQYEGEIGQHGVSCLNFSKKQTESTNILFFLKRKANPSIFEVKTSSGLKISATPDHPFYTPKGMRKLSGLKPGEKIAVFPFRGVVCEEAGEKVLVDERDIQNLNLPMSDYAQSVIINELRKRTLLPLKFNSTQTPYLIKILAYNLGDGNLTFTAKTKAAAFWGKEGDLKELAKDIKKVGYKASGVFKRKRNHKFKTKYSQVEFSHLENTLRVNARSFVVLLYALGAPIGRKATQDFFVPKWIMKSPLWYKRLFLAPFFGAEMSKPKTETNLARTFYMPTISVNKSLDKLKSGRRFLTQIKKLLGEFGVKSADIREVDTHVGRSGGKTKRLRLQIYGNSQNLTKLYELINFEYAKEKKFLANLAISYLKFKENILRDREKAEKEAKRLYLHQEEKSIRWIERRLTSYPVCRKFIERSIYEGRRTRPRIPPNFISFTEFIRENTKGLGKSGMVWDKIIALDEIPFKGKVYDFTVAHKDHNFIANNFVVSNCGVRLVLTNLTVDEVKPKIETLIDSLFSQVPAGVGCRSFLRLSKKEIDEVMVKGPAWCLGKGYGWREDLEATEDRGQIEGADPANVSQKAMERGLAQLGTLGSGNHYLEIQKVDKIFNPALAKEWGIVDKDQVTLMVHCGSRGFGHQIATDYLRVFGGAMVKYKISVPDRQLACAPFKSKEGQAYFSAMAAAANFAFANRQLIMHRVREVFEKVFEKGAESLGMNLVYDVAHNIAKIEEHFVNQPSAPSRLSSNSVAAKGGTSSLTQENMKGDSNLKGSGSARLPQASEDSARRRPRALVEGKKRLIVHRKGATRSFPGQPVIIGGSMESGSYLLVGTQKAMEETFGSTCHGSGRVMSRAKAKRQVRGDQLVQEMKAKGIYVRTASFAGLAEEAGLAYKNVSEVVDSVDRAGISRKVVSFVPIGNIKG